MKIEHREPGYNYNFDTETGFFMRWGDTYEDDPQCAPGGPEILDIEVSTVCHKGCRFCYKSNKANGYNMSLEMFKDIIDRMPTITQVAIGVGDIDGNPDLIEMMRYCRSKNIVPNITINGDRLTINMAQDLVDLCGAIAVSNYDQIVCLSTVHQLVKLGCKQVNIHQLLSLETLDDCWSLVKSGKLDEVNAVVFLSVKQKGRGEGYHPVPMPEYRQLVDYCLDNGVRIGFDSCGAHKFMEVIKDRPMVAAMEIFVEPCESGLFSSYINVLGNYYPCSFVEGIYPSINVLRYDDFSSVWNHLYTDAWRNKLLVCNRECPKFRV